MKIVEGNEPLHCDVGDASFHAMMEIAAAVSDEDLNQRIRKWMPLSFDAMVEAHFYVVESFYLTFLLLFSTRFNWLIGREF